MGWINHKNSNYFSNADVIGRYEILILKAAPALPRAFEPPRSTRHSSASVRMWKILFPEKSIQRENWENLSKSGGCRGGRAFSVIFSGTTDASRAARAVVAARSEGARGGSHPKRAQKPRAFCERWAFPAPRTPRAHWRTARRPPRTAHSATDAVRS